MMGTQLVAEFLGVSSETLDGELVRFLRLLVSIGVPSGGNSMQPMFFIGCP